MLTQKKLIVQKYGGATLSTPEKIKSAALRISEIHKTGTQIVVVVSAMGQTTNELIALAHQVSNRPQLRELDMLLTVGERISMSLLSMALNDLGCAAISFTGSQAGILTDEAHVNAQIIDVKAIRVEEALAENKIVIMAGFQGVSPITKEITTLGRGGSDTSAVAMAGYLKADRCEILKDVDGVHTADPKIILDAKPIEKLNYQHLIEMTSWGAKVLHQRSVQMAQLKKVILYVGPASLAQKTDTPHGTLIAADFESPTHQAIAVNSFEHIFELKLENSFAKFNSQLANNQISHPNFLMNINDLFYISGPQETLDSIEKFELEQNQFQITQKNISSVSLTFSSPVLESDLFAAEKELKKNKINLIQSFSLMNSLHFFVSFEQRSEAIKILHRFI